VKAAVEKILRIPKPLLALIAVVVASSILGPIFVSGGPSFESLERLEEAQESGEEASSSSDRLRKSLHEIAGNLQAGAGISEKGHTIGELTAKQQQSLLELVAVLKTQLDVLDRSSFLIGKTTESTKSLANISETQAENLKDAIGVLHNIKDLAAVAGTRSADLTRQARYGARLANDSKDAFRP
jgi:hypothetical protein